MNDFTKDELYQIELALDDQFPEPKELIKKIKFMIDSYCEHERDGKVYELQPEYKCIKCGGYYL